MEGETSKPILVTGAAGFIGYHVAKRLLEQGHAVIGVDGLTTYYDIKLKQNRLAALAGFPRFVFQRFMLEEADRLNALLETKRPRVVIHLGAQAGVRYSVENPRAYVDSNIVGTFNVLQVCRMFPPDHLLIASTSSVYGNGTAIPFKETAETSQPLSLYAATKKATEVMAHSYAHLYRIPTTVVRFFTVYGPWGRPDMALFKFTAAIVEGREIEIYGHGQMSRDFTYIDDLVDAIVGLTDRPPAEAEDGRPESISPVAPFQILNIGASQPVELEQFVSAVEKVIGRKALRKYLPMQAGDVRHTYADTSELRKLLPGGPPTPIEVGVAAFVNWYQSYYQPAERSEAGRLIAP